MSQSVSLWLLFADTNLIRLWLFFAGACTVGRWVRIFSLSNHLETHLSHLCRTVFLGFQCAPETRWCSTQYPSNWVLVFWYCWIIPHPSMLTRDTHTQLKHSSSYFRLGFSFPIFCHYPDQSNEYVMKTKGHFGFCTALSIQFNMMQFIRCNHILFIKPCPFSHIASHTAVTLSGFGLYRGFKLC